MAEYFIDKAYLVALADAIRSKSGTSSKMTPSAMVSAINNLGDMTYTPPSSPTVINKTGELYTIQDTTFNSLAKAIRNKAGISDKMTPHKMIDVVNGLEEANKAAFAVYSADDKSLNFYKRVSVPKVGQQFNGRTATNVYADIETTEYNAEDIVCPWESIKPNIKYITAIDKISPRSMCGWFASIEHMHTANIDKIDVSNTMRLDGLFADNFHNSCFRVNIESWNISDICNIDYIFDSLIPADGNGLTCLILGKGNVKIASKLPRIQYGTGRGAFNIRTNKYETYPVIESGSGGEYIFLSQHLMNDGPDKYAWGADFWK